MQKKAMQTVMLSKPPRRSSSGWKTLMQRWKTLTRLVLHFKKHSRYVFTHVAISPAATASLSRSARRQAASVRLLSLS